MAQRNLEEAVNLPIPKTSTSHAYPLLAQAIHSGPAESDRLLEGLKQDLMRAWQDGGGAKALAWLERAAPGLLEKGVTRAEIARLVQQVARFVSGPALKKVAAAAVPVLDFATFLNGLDGGSAGAGEVQLEQRMAATHRQQSVRHAIVQVLDQGDPRSQLLVLMCGEGAPGVLLGLARDNAASRHPPERQALLHGMPTLGILARSGFVGEARQALQALSRSPDKALAAAARRELTLPVASVKASPGRPAALAPQTGPVSQPHQKAPPISQADIGIAAKAGLAVRHQYDAPLGAYHDRLDELDRQAPELARRAQVPLATIKGALAQARAYLTSAHEAVERLAWLTYAGTVLGNRPDLLTVKAPGRKGATFDRPALDAAIKTANADLAGASEQVVKRIDGLVESLVARAGGTLAPAEAPQASPPTEQSPLVFPKNPGSARASERPPAVPRPEKASTPLGPTYTQFPRDSAPQSEMTPGERAEQSGQLLTQPLQPPGAELGVLSGVPPATPQTQAALQRVAREIEALIRRDGAPTTPEEARDLLEQAVRQSGQSLQGLLKDLGAPLGLDRLLTDEQEGNKKTTSTTGQEAESTKSSTESEDRYAKINKQLSREAAFLVAIQLAGTAGVGGGVLFVAQLATTGGGALLGLTGKTSTAIHLAEDATEVELAQGGKLRPGATPKLPREIEGASGVWKWLVEGESIQLGRKAYTPLEARRVLQSEFEQVVLKATPSASGRTTTLFRPHTYAEVDQFIAAHWPSKAVQSLEQKELRQSVIKTLRQEVDDWNSGRLSPSASQTDGGGSVRPRPTTEKPVGRLNAGSGGVDISTGRSALRTTTPEALENLRHRPLGELPLKTSEGIPPGGKPPGKRPIASGGGKEPDPPEDSSVIRIRDIEPGPLSVSGSRKINSIYIGKGVVSGIHKRVLGELESIGKIEGFKVQVRDELPEIWSDIALPVSKDGKGFLLVPNSSNNVIFARNQLRLLGLPGGNQGAAAARNTIKPFLENSARSGLNVRESRVYIEQGNILTTQNRSGDKYVFIGEGSLNISTKLLDLEGGQFSQNELIEAMNKVDESKVNELLPSFEKATRLRTSASAADDARAFLAKRELTKKVIASELGVSPDKIVYLPQVDFHLDLYLRPGEKGKFYIDSPNLSSQLLDKIKSMENVPAADRGLVDTRNLRSPGRDKPGSEVYLIDTYHYSPEHVKSMSSSLNATRAELEAKGFNVEELPGTFAGYQPGVVGGDKSYGYGANFINGIMGKGSDGKTFFITNKSAIPELNKEFAAIMAQKGIRVHFVEHDLLRQFGGINCITIESKLPNESLQAST